MKQTIFLQGNNLEKIRKEIKQNKGKEIILSCNNEDVYRKILEKEDIAVMLLEQKERKDRAKQRDSGLNQVLARIMKKKGTKIGIFLEELIHTSQKEKARRLARIKQNVKLAKKYGLKIVFITTKKSKKDLKDLKALALILGAPTKQVKEITSLEI